MTGINAIFALGSCAFFILLVAAYAYYKTRGEVDTKDGYFLAGAFIASSLLLTKLSAEQLIGLNGSAYA